MRHAIQGLWWRGRPQRNAGRARLDRHMDDEIRFHVEMRTEANLAAGMSRREARKDALRRFGDVDAIKKAGHEILGGAPPEEPPRRRLEELRDDIRFAARMIHRHPGFAAMAILTLAIGIGANTAIFSVTNGLVLRPLPGVRDRARLVDVAQGTDFVSVSYPVFKHLRDESETLEDLAAMDVVSMAMGAEGQPDVYFGLQITGNYFSVLGTQPAHGRFFAPEESFFPDVSDSVVISYDLWERRFGKDPDVLGEVVVLKVRTPGAALSRHATRARNRTRRRRARLHGTGDGVDGDHLRLDAGTARHAPRPGAGPEG